MKALEGARAALPGEDIQAAAAFVRSKGRDRNVVVAVTRTHVHLFKARMTGSPVAKTQRQERDEIDRAKRAMKRCIAEGHTVEEE